MVLKINPKFRDLCPEPTPEEFAQLEANIIKDGYLRDRIILWNGWIVDGHTRHRIATKHGIAIDRVTHAVFASEDDVCNWIIDNQLGRRNLSESQRAILATKRVTTKLGSNQHNGGSAKLQTLTQKQAAESAGVSERTLASAAKVVESHDKSLEKAVVDGKLAVDVAAAVAKLPEKNRAAFESGSLKASAKVINALAKKTSDEQAVILRDARKGIKSLNDALGAKKSACPKGGNHEPDEDGDCAKCKEPGVAKKKPLKKKGDAYEEKDGGVGIQRAKTVKTVEALMRAFDDLNGMLAKPAHKGAIASCKTLLQTARDWK